MTMMQQLNIFYFVAYFKFVVFIVYFRYVVFHPFMDEILTGKIKSCSKEGVHSKWLVVCFDFIVVICFVL